MSDQPDFTENTDLSAALSPEDLADLEARMQDIASRPAPTAENTRRFAEIREGSSERVNALVKEAEASQAGIAFDVTTPQGHIDAVTFARTSLLGIGGSVHAATADGDLIAASDLFSDAHDVWAALTPAVQFNVLLEFLMAIVGAAMPEDEQS